MQGLLSTPGRLSRRRMAFAGIAAALLAPCLVAATPTAAQAEDSVTVAGVTIPLGPGCVSIAPYRVPLDELTVEVSHFLSRMSAEGVTVRPDELVGYLFPTAQGQSFLLSDPGTGFELCRPTEGVNTGYELNAIAVGLSEWPEGVDVGIDADEPNGYQPLNDSQESQPKTWKKGPRGCFGGGVKGHSVRDVCWNHTVQVDDDRHRNYHQFFAEATGRRTENGEYMERIWVNADWRPGTAYQDRDGLPIPKADYSGSQDCSTSGQETEDSITVGSGSPVEFGWKRTHKFSHTVCDNYLAYNPTGGRVDWATAWKKASGTHGTTGTRQTALNLPVMIDSVEERPIVWNLKAGQDINVDAP